jgi:hypothetical protein
MNVSTMTIQDCYEAARQKTEIITSQRKLNRLLEAIAEKERYAARYKSRLICALYDCEIEALYAEVAVLEGYVMANELALEEIEAKRREAETQRLVRLFQFTAPTRDPAAPTPPASSSPRTPQVGIFGPGPAPIDTKPVGDQSAAEQEWATENDIAMGMELANEDCEEGSESERAVIAPAASPAASPAVALQAAPTQPEVVKPEPQPYRFAYTFDPPTAPVPVAQSPARQSPAQQSPAVAPTSVQPTQGVIGGSPGTVPYPTPLDKGLADCRSKPAILKKGEADEVKRG